MSLEDPHHEAAQTPERGGRRRLLVLIGGLVTLAVLGALAVKLLPVDAWLDGLRGWGEEVGPAAAILIGLLYVPVCVFVLPASALTYAMAAAFGVWPAFAGTMVGALSGSATVFLLGRHLARDLVARQAERQPLLGALDRVLDRRSFGMVVLIRLSPLFPFAVVGYALGATRVDFWRHLLATGLAIMPQAFLTCWVAATAAEVTRDLAAEGAAESPWQTVLRVVGIVAVLAVLATISARTRRALLERLEPGPNGRAGTTPTSGPSGS